MLHSIRISSKLDRHFTIDHSAVIKLHDSFIHNHHALLTVRLHHTHQLVGLPLTDQIADGMVGMQYLKGCHTSGSICLGNQLLGNNCL